MSKLIRQQGNPACIYLRKGMFTNMLELKFINVVKNAGEL
jgi:hypothetical protein